MNICHLDKKSLDANKTLFHPIGKMPWQQPTPSPPTSRHLAAAWGKGLLLLPPSGRKRRIPPATRKSRHKINDQYRKPACTQLDPGRSLQALRHHRGILQSQLGAFVPPHVEGGSGQSSGCTEMFFEGRECGGREEEGLRRGGNSRYQVFNFIAQPSRRRVITSLLFRGEDAGLRFPYCVQDCPEILWTLLD